MNTYFIHKNKRIKKYTIDNVAGNEVYKLNPLWSSYKKEVSLTSALKESNIPYKVQDKTLNNLIDMPDYTSKLTKYITDYAHKYKNIHLYFWSETNSTQKTTTALILAKLLIEKGYSAYFILMSDLLKYLVKTSFSEEIDTFINLLYTVDFLIIDDAFDPKKSTLYKSGYQIPFLDTFLRKRLECDERSTCFTSNIPIPNIEQSFGISLMKLLERSVMDSWEFTVPYATRYNFNITELWK